MSGTSFTVGCSFRPNPTMTVTHERQGPHESVAMTMAIHSQYPFGLLPTFTCECLHHSLNKRQTLPVLLPFFFFFLFLSTSLFHVEQHWPDLFCLDVNQDSITTICTARMPNISIILCIYLSMTRGTST